VRPPLCVRWGPPLLSEGGKEASRNPVKVALRAFCPREYLDDPQHLHTSSMRRIGGLSKRSKSVSVRRTTASAQRGGNVKGPTERSVRIRVLATIASATIAANSGDCSWRPPEPTQVGESPHPTTCALLTRPRVESRRAPRAEPANGALVPHSSSATFYRLPTTVAFGDQFRDREAEFGRPGW
jgi:hypothetical protein